MKTKLLRKVRRQARYELQSLTAFGIENGRVYRLRYPIGRDWVYDWMFGMRIDIYGNSHDEFFAICKIARLLWQRELRNKYAKQKGGAK